MEFQQTKKFRLPILIGFILLAVLLIVINNFRKKSEMGKQPAFVIPTPVVFTAGSYGIEPAVSTGVTTDKTREIDIIASSNNKSIVSYDFVITYDENSLEVLSAESLLPDFKVYPLEKSNYFVLTGVKDLESKTQTILDNQPIVRLKIIPKKKSTISLKIVESLGKEKSQMVDSKSEIIRPEVAEFRLEPGL